LKRKVLLAGGSHSDIPFISALHDMDCYVISSGNRAEDYGHQFADLVCLEDFSDAEAMLALARRLQVDAVCPSANDFSMLSCAYVAERLNLPGYDSHETTLSLHQKDHFRALARDLGLSCPKAIGFDSPRVSLEEIKDLRWPLMVKPVDLTGGKGVQCIRQHDEFMPAIRHAFDYSRAKRIVVEEFFSGSLHSYFTLIRNQKIIFEYCDNEFSFLNPYTVSTSSTPACVAPGVLATMRRETETLAQALGLADGIMHGQFLEKDEELRIIEFTRRPPGDLYMSLVFNATGINVADLAIRPFLNMPMPSSVPIDLHGFFSRHCLMADRNGIFKSCDLDTEIEANVVYRLLMAKPGRQVENYLNERLGILFLKYDSRAEMQEKTERIHQLVHVAME
jgi:biotin carboxylase